MYPVRVSQVMAAVSHYACAQKQYQAIYNITCSLILAVAGKCMKNQKHQL